MTEKFVVRLMDDHDALLAWAEVQAESKPQGERRSCPFWATAPTLFAVEAAGTATKIVVHWCDLDLVRVSPVPATPVEPGQVLNFTWIEPVWLVPAPEKQQMLPPVTVRAPQTVTVPTGALLGRT